ncbi:MAG TPA: HAD family hydrolase [Vicinamibacterales bacterium]|nr:HAD family hydrolase [Vicinamibacterales bacterium]
MAIQTVFLDAGGVLVYPNWVRVSDALGRHGVAVSAAALAAAEPHAKKRIDSDQTIQATSDQQRGWTYFNLVLERAGVALSTATDAALAELHAYHQEHNLWETVGGDVRPALAALRALGCRLVVVSNANGTLQRVFARLGLAAAVDAIFDSCDEGVEKPDPRFFEIALARSGSAAQSTVHVGDLYHVDVVGARRAGLDAILLDAADLYAGCDCRRVRSMTDLVAAVGVLTRQGERV